MIGRGLIWIVVAVLAGFVLRRWLDVVEVRGRSMAPALLPGDRLLVARVGPPRVGDVVLAADPRDGSRELVKRVAGLDEGGVTLRGDNGSRSTDGRTFGALPPSAVRWRVIGRYWPAERIGRVPASVVGDDLHGQ
jgi:nickel-type superoxide dismutase maturation protease